MKQSKNLQQLLVAIKAMINPEFGLDEKELSKITSKALNIEHFSAY